MMTAIKKKIPQGGSNGFFKAGEPGEANPYL